MLGIFLQELSRGAVRKVHAADLRRGQVALSLRNGVDLNRNGLPQDIQFGIVSEKGRIICQCCSGSEIETALFRVRELSAEAFMHGGRELYVMNFPDARDEEEVYRCAAQRTGKTLEDLRSFPGDDFVAECVWGQSMEELFEGRFPQIGRHWVTKIELKPSEILEWLGVSLEKPAALIDACVPDCFLPDLTHHGIVIEGEQVIHFSSCRLGRDECRIKVDSKRDFMSWKSGKSDGGQVAYASESVRDRMLCRNRAVWVFSHATQWGKYNLQSNNCEHFCRYCRVGVRGSRQVIGQLVAIAGQLANIPSPYQKVFMGLARAGGKINAPNRIPAILELIDSLTTLNTNNIIQ